MHDFYTRNQRSHQNWLDDIYDITAYFFKKKDSILGLG